MSFILIQPFVSLAQEDVDPKIQENNEHKCAVVITSRINDNQDPYQYALDRIRMCKKADILAVNSFLDSLTTKVYFCLLYTSPSPRDKRQSRMPSSA